MAFSLCKDLSRENLSNITHSSVAMLNYLPIAGQAAQLVAEVLFCGFSDLFRTRLPFLLTHAAISITSLTILIVRPANEHAYMAGWFLNYIGGVSTMLLCAWASAHLQHEPEVRTVLFATGTILSYINNAFIPLAAYPAREAPHWRIGAKLYLGFACVATAMYVGIWFGFRWEEKKKAKNNAPDSEVADLGLSDSDQDGRNSGGVTPVKGL